MTWLDYNSVYRATLRRAAIWWQHKAAEYANDAEYYRSVSEGYKFSREYFALATQRQDAARAAHEEMRMRLERLIGVS